MPKQRTNKFAIYARVSTDRQELEQQILSCQRFCEVKQLEVADIYAETISGVSSRRKEYLRLVENLRAFRYAGVVVFRIDRLGRNARELALLVDELEGKNIKVYSVNENFDTSTAMGRAMREIIMILAQLEREQISEATSQRLQSLKAAGKKLGRKPASIAQAKKVRQMSRAGASIRQIESRTHLSYGTVRNIVKGEGVYGLDPYRSL